MRAHARDAGAVFDWFTADEAYGDALSVCRWHEIDVTRSVDCVSQDSNRVPIKELPHHLRPVLDRAEAGESLKITRDHEQAELRRWLAAEPPLIS